MTEKTFTVEEVAQVRTSFPTIRTACDEHLNSSTTRLETWYDPHCSPVNHSAHLPCSGLSSTPRSTTSLDSSTYTQAEQASYSRRTLVSPLSSCGTLALSLILMH